MSRENRESSQSTLADIGGPLRSVAATLETWPEGARSRALATALDYSACWSSMTTATWPTACRCW